MKKIFTILMAVLVGTLFSTTSMAFDFMGMDIHGFLSQGYLATLENSSKSAAEGGNDFLFSEVGINFAKELNDDLHFGIQMFSRDFHESESVGIDIDWAFADYRFQDWLGTRVGQMKMPHGMYNDIRDIDMLHNSIFLPESVYQELSDDLFSDFYVSDLYLSLQGISSRELYLSLIGIGIYGYVELGFAGEIAYQVMYGTQNIDMDNTAGERQVQRFIDALIGVELENSDILENDEIDVDYKYAANVIWDLPIEGLRLGVSLDNIKMTGTSHFSEDFNIPTGDSFFPVANAGDKAVVEYNKLENWVGSLEYTWNDFIFMAEYIKTFKKYNVITVGSESKKSDPWGWYVGGAYRFLDWFELGGYYSRSENNDMDLAAVLPPIDYFFDFNDYCVTTRFDINAYLTIKLEGHQFKGTYAKQALDQFFSQEHSEVEKSWKMVAARATVAF